MFLSPQLLRLATDARLVALVRERNPAAFEAVYNRHHRAILSFCRHMLGDPQEAEDAVQQTFLAAYSDLIATDKPIHLRAWLFTIARNRCYTLLRGRREQPTSELEEPVTEGLASQVQRREDLRDLVVDLRRLPDDQRAALVLAELDSLSHEEIAIALGVPREKVKALVFQARESLVASRTARETDCADIREQLSTQRGGALRRGNLRRHLRECPGCREFRHQVEHQRRQLAALLPVVPTVALKEGVLGGTIGGGAAAGVGAGGMVVSTALKSGLAKGALGALLAGAGAAGTIVATHGLQAQAPPRAQAPVLPAATGDDDEHEPDDRRASQGGLGEPGSDIRHALGDRHRRRGADQPVLGRKSSRDPEWVVHQAPGSQPVRLAARDPDRAERRVGPALSGARLAAGCAGLAGAGRPRDGRAAASLAADRLDAVPGTTTPSPTSPTGTTHHDPGTTPTGTSRGSGTGSSSSGSSSHSGSVGPQKGGGDGGSGYPSSPGRTTGSGSGGSTRGQGSSGSSGD